MSASLLSAIVVALSPLLIKLLGYWVDRYVSDESVKEKWREFRKSVDEQGQVPVELKEEYDAELNELDQKHLLVREALSWVGVREHGTNSGEIVEMFQRAIGPANHESWCMSFVQFCVAHVDHLCEAPWPVWAKHKLKLSEHCLTVWRESNAQCRSQIPQAGSIIIWQHGDSDRGHTGIVSEVFKSGMLTVVEGNASSGPGVIREGDGVYQRERDPMGDGDMKVVGYLRPWL